MKKENLKVKDQIEYMSNSKGILFNITDKETAEIFLENNNYYFKLKSYAKNFEQYKLGENKGKYINLEFAYLQELSRLDMIFRKVIIDMTLDIEHFIKTELVNECSKNHIEDGYIIAREFLNKNSYVEKEIKRKAQNNNSACSDLIRKYGTDLAIWNLVEVLSFGDLIKLYSMYYDKYKDKRDIRSLLWSVKFLRNAAAHNSCLLNTLRVPYTGIRSNKQVNTYISKIEEIKPEERRKKMQNPIIHDFIVTIYVFYIIVKSNTTKKNALIKLKKIIDERFTENKEYFSKNQIIRTNYKFVKKVVDHFYNLSI